MKPILKWVGSKASLADQLLEIAGYAAGYHRWVEPFAGSAALFFKLQPRRALLNDRNARLISFYQTLCTTPISLFDEIIDMARRYEHERHGPLQKKALYLQWRDGLAEKTGVELAARVYAVNKLCFNGLWRENKSGDFNVPWGQRKTLPLPNPPDWSQASAALVRADTTSTDFDKLDYQPGDFVYFDPPYETTFGQYQSSGWGVNDLYRLRALCERLHGVGIPCMVSNLDTELVREVFSGYTFHEIETAHKVKGGKAQAVRELCITNF